MDSSEQVGGSRFRSLYHHQQGGGGLYPLPVQNAGHIKGSI